jgi:hypothetical protein
MNRGEHIHTKSIVFDEVQLHSHDSLVNTIRSTPDVWKYTKHIQLAPPTVERMNIFAKTHGHDTVMINTDNNRGFNMVTPCAAHPHVIYIDALRPYVVWCTMNPQNLDGVEVRHIDVDCAQHDEMVVILETYCANIQGPCCFPFPCHNCR